MSNAVSTVNTKTIELYFNPKRNPLSTKNTHTAYFLQFNVEIHVHSTQMRQG